MKLYATLKNERGGNKSTADDTCILVELVYKNKTIGTIGIYAIGNDEGVRIVWDETGKGAPFKTIYEDEVGKCSGVHESVQAIINCPVCKNNPLLKGK